jgi:hypothetical protein
MRTLCGASLATLVGSALLLGHGLAQAPEQGQGGIELRVVKYNGLAQEVLKHRGKVVVIDMWQFT